MATMNGDEESDLLAQTRRRLPTVKPGQLPAQGAPIGGMAGGAAGGDPYGMGQQPAGTGRVRYGEDEEGLVKEAMMRQFGRQADGGRRAGRRGGDYGMPVEGDRSVLKEGASDDDQQPAIDALNDQSMAANEGEDMGAAESAPTNDLAWRKTLKYQNMNMPGFNTSGEGYDDKAANSAKNTFGRIASRYEAKPSSLKLIEADPDFQRAFPGAYFDEKDRLHIPAGTLSDFESGVDIGGPEGIDVLAGADVGSDSAVGWSWQDLMNDAGGGDAAGGGGGGMFGGGIPGNLDELAEGGNLDDIMAMINQLAEGQNPYESEALAQLLQQGNADAVKAVL